MSMTKTNFGATEKRTEDLGGRIEGVIVGLNKNTNSSKGLSDSKDMKLDYNVNQAGTTECLVEGLRTEAGPEGTSCETEKERQGLANKYDKAIEELGKTAMRTKVYNDEASKWRPVPGRHGWVGVGVGGVGELMEQKLNVTGAPLPPLPPDTKPLSHQVAGHVYGKSSSRLGMLECGDGTILKPLPDGCCGERELAFYERVWHNTLRHLHCVQAPASLSTNYSRLEHLQKATQDCAAKGGYRTVPNGFIRTTNITGGAEDGFDLVPLDEEDVNNEGKGEVPRMEEEVWDVLNKAQKLTPLYLGTYIDPATPEVQYLRLGDLTYKFRRPCIADIKIGRRSYDPEATPDKITKELHKYPPQQKLCFQLKGMRSYCRKKDQFTTCSKEYLRCLDEEGVQREGFARFFDNGSGIRKDVVNLCIEKLQPIIEWTKQQRLFAFYASSILVIFEGAFKSCDCPHIEESFQDKTMESVKQSISGNLAEQNSKGTCSIKNIALSIDASEHQGKDGTVRSASLAAKLNPCYSPKDKHHQTNPNTAEHREENENPVNLSEGGAILLQKNTVSDVRLSLDKSKGCSCKRVEVKMIDFARVFPIDKLDTNYLEGLISLKGHFEQLLQAE